ncbi:hypothetical protein THAOC_33005, partial [Thalassiosira oceanica]
VLWWKLRWMLVPRLFSQPDPRADSKTHKKGRPLDPALEGLEVKRVKPIPLGILLEAQRIAEQNGSPAMMMWIAYFFLCRPGEYCSTVDEGNMFFRLWTACNVGLRNGDRALDLATASPEELRCATFAMLEFTDQKNCNQPRRKGGTWYLVTPPALTMLLREAASNVGYKYGIEPMDISAHSMRASGAMALLCADVDPVKIRLLGRWKTDTMLQYLLIQAPTLVRGLASGMLAAGKFSFLPETRQYRLVNDEQTVGLYKD